MKKKLRSFSWGRHKYSGFLMLALFGLCIAPALSQTTVSGTVTSQANGETLPGVNILVKGSGIGTVTDIEGQYSLEIPDHDGILVFSFIGFYVQEVPIEGRSRIDVAMTEDLQNLDEVVVVGYGTQRKATLTGAIASVEGKDLVHSPAINVSNSLAGMAPGLVALNRSGEPGRDNAQIYIRGQSTTGDTSPLVVVDGIQDYPGWQRINPNDIESISILKDASAAIYGARAANGVILITTKRGTEGKATFNYSFNEGITQPTRVPEMADAVLYAEFVNELMIKQGQVPKYTEEAMQKFRDGTDPYYANTDWYDEVLKDFSSQRQHNLSISGGTENGQYYVSGTHSFQDGIFKNGSTNYKNYSIVARVDTRLNDHISLGFDLNGSLDDSNYPFSTSSIFSSLGNIRPDEPVYWPNGMPSAGIAAGNNPAVMATDAAGNDNQKNRRFVAKGSVDIKIPWVEGLGVDGFYYYTDHNYKRKHWQTPWITNSYNRTTGQYDVVVGGGILAPQLTEYNTITTNNLFNVRLKYERQFGDHYINTFIAGEQSVGQSNDFSAHRKDFLSPALDQLFAGSLVGMRADGSASESSRQNVFGRVSYNFDEKYLIDFNFRYDGSSNFPKGRRWGFFPGGSVAWNLSEENFIKDNFNFVDLLKIRGSYGEIGNDQVPSFQWLSTYNLGSNGYPFGLAGETSLGLVAGVVPNEFITWEVAKVSNIGLDAALWRGLLGVTLEVFKQRRSNILAKRDLAVPFFTGLTLPNENIGVVENKGIELELRHANNQLGEFSYSIAGNFGYAKNKVIDISEPAGILEWQKQEGRILGSLLLYEAVGIFRTEEQLEEHPVVPGTVVGDLMYRDYDGNGVITQADMRRVPQSNIPQITFGANLSASYRQFSLWAHFAGQAKSWRQFHKHSKDGGHNSLRDLLANRYKPGSMDSKYPIVPDSELQTSDVSGFASTFWLRDASFVRLKTLELSYNLPNEWISVIGLNNMRVYVNGNNLLTFDKLEWYDPEGDHLTGAFYPQNKIYNLGVNVSF